MAQFPVPQAPAGARAEETVRISADSDWQHLRGSSSPHSQEDQEQKKPSFMTKLKDKTKKLKQKVKNEFHTTDAAATTVEHEYSSEDDTEPAPSTKVLCDPLPKHGEHSEVNAESDGAGFMSPFKNVGPPSTLQAVPTEYNYQAVSPHSTSLDGGESDASLETGSGVPELGIRSSIPPASDMSAAALFSTGKVEWEGSKGAEKEEEPFSRQLHTAAKAVAGEAEQGSDGKLEWNKGDEEGDVESSRGDERKPPLTQRAVEGINAVKENVVAAIYGDDDKSTAQPDSRDTKKTWTEALVGLKDVVGSAKEAIVSKLGYAKPPTVDEGGNDVLVEEKCKVVGEEQIEGAGKGAHETKLKSDDTGSALAQMMMKNLQGLSLDAEAAKNASTSEAEKEKGVGAPVTESVSSIWKKVDCSPVEEERGISHVEEEHEAGINEPSTPKNGLLKNERMVKTHVTSS